MMPTSIYWLTSTYFMLLSTMQLGQTKMKHNYLMARDIPYSARIVRFSSQSSTMHCQPTSLKALALLCLISVNLPCSLSHDFWVFVGSLSLNQHVTHTVQMISPLTLCSRSIIKWHKVHQGLKLIYLSLLLCITGMSSPGSEAWKPTSSAAIPLVLRLTFPMYSG